jgi:CO dehydrogenase nickel-insertion accessory protein CooC1
MGEETHLLGGKKIGIFGKGGAGKSTVTTFLAQSLHDRGYQVCVLDADSTNVGLHRALGVDEPPLPLMDYFGDTVFRGGRVTCPVDDPTPLSNAAMSWDDLPEPYQTRTSEGITYLVAGKIGDQGPGAGCDGPVAKVARDFSVRSISNPVVTLIDFKAGFEDSARGVITGLDWVIVVIDPTGAAIQMAADMKHMVDQIQAGVLPATQHLETLDLVELARSFYRKAQIKGVLFILNRVTDPEMEQYLRGQLARSGLEPSGVIHTDTSVSSAWLKGAPLMSTTAKREVQATIETLEHIQQSIMRV